MGGRDPADAWYAKFVQTGIVGDEKVDAGGHGAGQMDSIGAFDLCGCTYVREGVAGHRIEGDDLAACEDTTFQVFRKFRTRFVEGFDLYLAQSQRGGQ